MGWGKGERGGDVHHDVDETLTPEPVGGVEELDAEDEAQDTSKDSAASRLGYAYACRGLGVQAAGQENCCDLDFLSFREVKVQDHGHGQDQNEQVDEHADPRRDHDPNRRPVASCADGQHIPRLSNMRGAKVGVSKQGCTEEAEKGCDA